MRRRSLAGILAVSALLASVGTVAAKAGGENPVGTCSDSYVAMTIEEFALAYPFEWETQSDHVITLYAFIDKNGNGKLCVKERSQNAQNYADGFQANFVEDSKKSGTPVI